MSSSLLLHYIHGVRLGEVKNLDGGFYYRTINVSRTHPHHGDDKPLSDVAEVSSSPTLRRSSSLKTKSSSSRLSRRCLPRWNRPAFLASQRGCRNCARLSRKSRAGIKRSCDLVQF